MTDEIRYKVGVMTVTLTIENGVPVEAECECEEWATLQQDALRQTSDEQKCRHIRETEMYHHYEQKVEAIE